MRKREKSNLYYNQAVRLMPGGVNSPVRAFKAVGGNPVFIKKGSGSRIYDIDGNAYIDYVLSWGPLILGHAHKKVVKAIRDGLNSGTSFGAPTEAEVELAGIIKEAFPSMEMIRLVNSGTEATMSAIRLARAFTKKDKVIKFSGCYHGHSDSLLVKAGSGALTFGVPTSLGVPKSFAHHTLVLPYNDIDRLVSVISKYHRQIAAVIIEPICGNMGVVLPKENFLADLRQITKKYKILLIFDEIITGFRFCFGGAQSLFRIKPDITCLGKIIGGGLPIGAYGSCKEIMSHVSPLGGMYQAGTLSGNPLAVAGGLKTLQILKKLDYNKIDRMCAQLCWAIQDISQKKKVDLQINRFGSMFTLFFTKGKVFDHKTAIRSDTKKYAKFFRKMLEIGIYFTPSQFEANFLSFAHSQQDMVQTIKASQAILE